MRVIAHRGFAAEAPENTVAALRRAARLADGVELDVRRCGSGEPVVVHDATVDRVTGGTGPVADHSLADLRSLDVLDSGEPIPGLREALAAVPDDVLVNVELKETGLAADVVDALEAVDNPAIVSSFSRTALREVRAASRSVPTAYLVDSLRDRPVSTAIELDCQYVHPRYSLCLYSPLVARARAVDLKVNAWTVTRTLAARRLATAGVDGVITDRTDLLGGRPSNGREERPDAGP